MDDHEERELVERARRDPEAFGALFDRYHPKIFGYVLRRVGDAEAAQDITADVFFRALDRLWQFRWRNLPFSAWLYRIAANGIVTHARREGRRAAVSLDALLEEHGLEPASPADLKAELEEAERALERHREFLEMRGRMEALPRAYREALALRFFEDKKLSEIAAILGKKEGTVKSLLSRGLAKLRAAQPSSGSGVVDGERSPGTP